MKNYKPRYKDLNFHRKISLLDVYEAATCPESYINGTTKIILIVCKALPKLWIKTENQTAEIVTEIIITCFK